MGWDSQRTQSSCGRRGTLCLVISWSKNLHLGCSSIGLPVLRRRFAPLTSPTHRTAISGSTPSRRSGSIFSQGTKGGTSLHQLHLDVRLSWWEESYPLRVVHIQPFVSVELWGICPQNGESVNNWWKPWLILGSSRNGWFLLSHQMGRTKSIVLKVRRWFVYFWDLSNLPMDITVLSDESFCFSETGVNIFNDLGFSHDMKYQSTFHHYASPNDHNVHGAAKQVWRNEFDDFSKDVPVTLTLMAVIDDASLHANEYFGRNLQFGSNCRLVWENRSSTQACKNALHTVSLWV